MASGAAQLLLTMSGVLVARGLGPEDRGYLALIVLVVVIVQLKGWWRVAVVPPTLVLTAFVWENLLIQQPAVTRYVLFGVLLIALMATRPQGLFGTAKVEIV